MICPDVNVLLYAFREDSERHEEYRDWLLRSLTGAEPVGPSELVLSGSRGDIGQRHAIPEAYHAALAMEHGATWVTTDRGFAAYPGLSWRHPFER